MQSCKSTSTKIQDWENIEIGDYESYFITVLLKDVFKIKQFLKYENIFYNFLSGYDIFPYVLPAFFYRSSGRISDPAHYGTRGVSYHLSVRKSVLLSRLSFTGPDELESNLGLFLCSLGLERIFLDLIRYLGGRKAKWRIWRTKHPD